MKRIMIVFITLLLSLLITGCTQSTGDTKTGVLTADFEEVFIGNSPVLKSIVKTQHIIEAFKYQNDVVLLHQDSDEGEASISKFHRGIKTWSYTSHYQLQIIEQVDNTLVIHYPDDSNGFIYTTLDLNSGKVSTIVKDITSKVIINNHRILTQHNIDNGTYTLYLLEGTTLTELTTTSDNLLEVSPINDETFYISEINDNDEFSVTVFDVQGNKYGTKVVPNLENLVQYDKYFYYLDFLDITIYDFDFDEIISYQFEYRIGTTITIEGYDDEGLILDVDRFVSKSFRKLLYDGEVIVDYRSNNFKEQNIYASYIIENLYRFENGDTVQLHYHPHQNPSGKLKRISSTNEVIWNIDIEDEFIKYLVFDEFVRILTPSVIHDYSFEGKLVKIINTKCTYPETIFEVSYTCEWDRLYVYDYNNDQVFEQKYLTDPEYFHSSYDYYIISDFRLNESINKSYHYYNFYQNDGDIMFRVNVPFVDQFNVDGRTFVLVANLGEDNEIIDSFSLLEYNSHAEIINEFETFITDNGIFYLDGPTLVILEQ